MSDLKEADHALFFISVLYNKEFIAQTEITDLLSVEFGSPLTFHHDYFPMKDYYSKEMGKSSDLDRYFLFFPRPLDRTKLVDAKIFCDSLERKYLNSGNRQFNVDPGYISADQVILATGKPYSHRIYLERGVYGELTYRFEGQSFTTLDWTYPDYAHEDIISHFNWFRQFLFFTKNS
jgi:hypothetical protein